jgi:hypothetical protein
MLPSVVPVLGSLIMTSISVALFVVTACLGRAPAPSRE